MKHLNFIGAFLMCLFILHSNAQTITGVTPNNGIQGQTLPVQISGNLTHFVSGTSTANVWFQQGTSTLIFPSTVTASSEVEMNAQFNFLLSHPQGYYNVYTTNFTDGTVMLNSGFYLNPAPSCYAAFTIVPDPDTLHHYYAYSTSTGTGALNYLWNWGDGATDNTPYPSHTYASGGNYNICITITDQSSCTSSACNPYNLMRLAASATPVTITVLSSPLGISEQKIKSSWTVYPSPALDRMSISFPAEFSSQIRFTLSDVSGKTVKEIFNGNSASGDNTIHFSTSDLTPGIYFLHFEHNKKTEYRKIVVGR